MDLNNILSLLKEAEKAEKDTLDIKSLDLTRIDSNLIQQVRNEYLTKNATTITPEVLVVIGNMAKETHLIQVLKKCKDRQDKKEKELFAHRESVKIRHKKQKENLQTKELIGVKVDMNELQKLERECKNELYELDLQILKDLDKEVLYLQQELVKLNVPLFKISKDPKDIKLQRKVLDILQNMME